MKQFKLLVVALVAVSSACFAANETNRSYLKMQGQRDKATHKAFICNMMMANNHENDMSSSKSTKNGNGKSKKSKNGHRNNSNDNNDEVAVTLMTTGNYSRSWGNEEMGEYFGVQKLNSFSVNGDPGDNDVNLDFILGRHDTTAVDLGLDSDDDVTLTLKPRNETWGGHLDLNIDLNNVVEGLSLHAGTAVMHSKNDLHAAFENDSASFQANQVSSLTDYFNGSGSSTVVQDALTHGKIDGESHGETRLADIDLMLKYNFVEQDKHSFGLYLAGRIATGNEPDAVLLFEPVVGSRQHRFGGGLCGDCQVFDNNGGDSRGRLVVDVNWQYGFERTEKRVVDIKDVNWAKYHLAQETGKTTVGGGTDQPFFPAANVLAQDLKVEQRSVVKAMAKFCYAHQDWFNFDAGYHLCWKQEEDNKFKTDWVDDKYYRIANVAYVPATAPEAQVAGRAIAINKDDLLLNHESQLFHSIFATLAYVSSDGDYPWGVGIGGSVNFSNDERTSPRSWDIYSKFGINF